MVVEIALGSNGFVFFGEYGKDQFLCGRFAIASGKAYNFGFAMVSVVSGKFLEGM